MPAMPSAPGVLQVVVRSQEAGFTHEFISRFHLHYSGAAPAAADLVTMANTLLISWAAQFAPLMATPKSITGIKIIDLSSPIGAVGEVSAATAGTLAGTELPQDVCVVLAGQIARRYRGGHPRIYLPLGVVASVATPRTWAGPILGAASAAMATFVGVATGAGWAGAGTITCVNISYYFGSHLVTYPSGRHRDVPTLRVGGPVVDPVTSWIPRAAFGTQRRRLAA